LREGDYKKAIGPALVEAKYATIAWLNKDKDDAAQDVDGLRETLRNLAAQTNVRHLPDYAPIHEGKLVAALDSLQDAKRLLGPKDKLTIETPEGRIYEADLSKTWEPSEVISLEKVTTEKQSEGEIILTIRKPDMTDNAMWGFTRGKFPVSARITHEKWLDDFHARKIPLYSGDAMRGRVKFLYFFDDTGTLVEEKIEIIEVLEIIRGAGGEQTRLDV
jgi:hypothetical protein